MLDLMINAALYVAAAIYWGVSAYSLLAMWRDAPAVTTPMDGFHRSIDRWGYVNQARGQE